MLVGTKVFKATCLLPHKSGIPSFCPLILNMLGRLIPILFFRIRKYYFTSNHNRIPLVNIVELKNNVFLFALS